MALKCNCVLVSKVGVLSKYTYRYRCQRDGKTVHFVFPASTDIEADVLVCGMYEDPNDMGVPPPGGIGGGCIPLDTPILLADRTTKLAGDLALGDQILCGAFEERKLISMPLTGLWYDYDVSLVEVIRSDGDKIITSLDQPLITTGGPVRAAYVFEGANLFAIEESRGEVSRSESTIIGRNNFRMKGDVVSLDFGGDYFYFVGREPVRWLLTCHKSDNGMNHMKY